MIDAEPSRSGPTPKHLALRRLLLREIRTGRWTDGHRLPPERELITHYGVSITTVRRCLHDLVRGGYLVRHRRRGTFVTALAEVQSERAFGLLCDCMTVTLRTPYLLRLVAGLEQQVAEVEAGLRLLSTRELERAGRPGRAVAELVRQRGLDGLFLASPFAEDWMRDLKEAPGAPPLLAVQIDYSPLGIPCLLIDVERLLGQACGHLLQLGHRRLAVLHGKWADASGIPFGAARRSAAVLETLNAQWRPQGVRIDFLAYRYFDREDIERLVRPLFAARPARPTALVVQEHGVAHLVRDLAQEAGWSVPRDLSIVTLEAGSPYTQFTAVEPQVDNLCWRSVRLMEQMLEGVQPGRLQEWIGSDLVVRHSTAAPPAAARQDGRKPLKKRNQGKGLQHV